MIISFVNQKGGVGKTTTTQAVATALAMKGKKVLALDLDPQANLGIVEGIPVQDLEYTMSDFLKGDCTLQDVVVETNNYHLIPSMIYLAGTIIELDAKLNRYLILDNLFKEYSIKEYYDFVILDCPPSLGFLTLNALASSDYVGLVSEAEFLSKEALYNLENTITQVKEGLNKDLKHFGVIITKYDKRTNHSNEIAEELEEKYKDIHCFRIPMAVTVKDSPRENMQSIVAYEPNHRSAKAYIEIAEAILDEQK